MAYTPEHVPLVGSIGLPSGRDVFRTCGRLLGNRLQRIPDGEPGGNALEARTSYENFLEATRPVPNFGIATECGFARARKPSVVERLLELHAAGSREPMTRG